jgi:hypothetical protein
VDPRQVWAGAENLACSGIRSPDRPARTELLYRPVRVLYAPSRSPTYQTRTGSSEIELSTVRTKIILLQGPSVFLSSSSVPGSPASRCCSAPPAMQFQSSRYPKIFVPLTENFISGKRNTLDKKFLPFVSYPVSSQPFQNLLTNTCHVSHVIFHIKIPTKLTPLG